MNNADLLQFYPTPRSLAVRAFAKFRRPIERLLEPSAGRGDLLWPTHEMEHDEPGLGRYRYRKLDAAKIDCIEADLANHPLLREQGYRVIGHDFLKYEGATIWSSVLMNPPFAYGAEHVLHAWDLLYSGELVAILNAETLRRPHTAKRQLLARLVEQHSASEPEYLQQAFLSPDTQRQTAVEIVIIHLEKTADFKAEFLDDLAKESRAAATEHDFGAHTELMLPKSWIENQVTAFTLATQALKDAAIADVRASYYAGMLGRSLADPECKDQPAGDAAKRAAEKINAGYDKLKESAWTSVLRSTDVTSRLSSKAQERLEAQFKTICELEFTVQNIYGFLGGLLAKQGDIQLEMLCDVFDSFTRYHDDNLVYYQGWKSNTKHRQCGMALRASRIVLPAARRDWYDARSTQLAWDDVQRFRDFDRVFALLDGKTTEGLFGIERLFDRDMVRMAAGERGSSAYFDVRFYPKSGTFHLFPRRKDLVDRLNRLVGQQRAWLPPEGCATPPGFWEQFSEAEKINKAADLAKVDRWYLARGDEREQAREQEKVAQALAAGAAKLGIEYDPDNLLTQMPESVRLPLKKAA